MCALLPKAVLELGHWVPLLLKPVRCILSVLGVTSQSENNQPNFWRVTRYLGRLMKNINSIKLLRVPKEAVTQRSSLKCSYKLITLKIQI